MERLPSEQQEPTGPALQRCDGGFQESDLQSDYQQLEEMCLDLENTKSTPHPREAKHISVDQILITHQQPRRHRPPWSHRSRIQALMSLRPLNHCSFFFFFLSATRDSVKKSKEDTIPGSP